MLKLRYLANRAVHWLSNLIGSKIVDHQTGEVLGKAIIIGISGRIHILGYQGPDFLIEFEPQDRLTYWKQSIRFTQHLQKPPNLSLTKDDVQSIDSTALSHQQHISRKHNQLVATENSDRR